MQNLLNEEEFLQPEPYNPWRWFLTFYGFIFCCSVAVNIIGYFNPVDELLEFNIVTISLIFIFTLFMASPYLMIFTKKKIVHNTNFKTLFFSTLLLTIISYLSGLVCRIIRELIDGYTIADIIINNAIMERFYSLLFFIIYGLFSFFIIYLILRKKRKKATI